MRPAKAKAPAQTVRSANISDVFWVERHRSRATLGFQGLKDRQFVWRFFSRDCGCAVSARRERDCVASRRHSHRRRRQSEQCRRPFRFPYRASSSFCCGSPRTNDDASHPKRFRLVLRPAQATSAQQLHVCPHQSPRLRSCLRCCSKCARLLHLPPRILDFLQAESSPRR